VTNSIVPAVKMRVPDSRPSVAVIRLAGLTFFLLVGALAGCGDDVTAPQSPPNLSMAGDHQSAFVLDPLPNPLTVTVNSANGAPLGGETVHWSVVSGGGTLSAASVVTDQAGHASVNWTLGAAEGLQEVEASVPYRVAPGPNGLSSAKAQFTASASRRPVPQPVILHYDGTGWTVSVQTVNMPPVLLNSIWGASSVLFAVGAECQALVFMRYDGTAWSQPPDNRPNCELSEVVGVSGTSSTNVWAVTHGAYPPSIWSSLYAFDGQSTWYPKYNHGCSLISPPCDPYLNAVWSGSPNLVIAVGDGGFIVRFNGTDWTPEASGTTQRLQAVWGPAPGTTAPVFAVGDGGTILYYDGSAWQPQTSGTTQPLYAIWGTSINDVFAAGGGGTILHYDGTSWLAQSSPVGSSLRGVWGSSANSVFVVGDDDTILHYDGSTWTTQSITAPINLRGVWGTSPTNVFAVGRATNYP
jgi:hypothetical protein